MECCNLGGRVPAHLWTRRSEVEAEALTQLGNISRLPWVEHLAVMPDVHFGKGATVGSVIGMRGAVSPAAVGVDIGCGMGAVRTNLVEHDMPDSLHDLRLAIEETIPVGFNGYERPAFFAASREVRKQTEGLLGQFSSLTHEVQGRIDRTANQLGTLGGGNHFIELCFDEGSRCDLCRGTGDLPEGACYRCEGNGTARHAWLMLHSGSRNIGKELAEVHINRAKKLAHNQDLPDPDLAVFLAATPEMQTYRHDLYWAQRYAMLNRSLMLERYMNVMRRFFPNVTFEEPVLCHHNYVAEEHHFGEDLIVTRKGAIRAGAGEMGIIPGSRGTRSYIVRGLGNPQALHSASHGAGRRMSRSKAKKTYSLEDLAAQTAGIECRKDKDVLDEIPGAYKDIDQVMADQADLVEVVARLSQVLCVKG
ncbi:RtcB family protein [Candidatus Uhrbacteria bacterium]|nr:RtcB family protein [Candidatus Uhrbacteria bacterium]